MNNPQSTAGDGRARPTFIVIGAAKAGTTALYWYLSEHPQVHMSPLKETNFFAFGLDDSGHLLYGDPDLHRFPIRDEDSYLELFSEAGDSTAIGEASPIYLECPQAAGRIAAALPDVKIVCGLRNPVDRAYSDYQMYLRSRGRDLDAGETLTADAAWAQPDSHWMRIGRYHEMLSRYLTVFRRDQVHVYLFEEMKRQPLEVVQSLYHFLGVDPAFRPDLETPHNVGGLPARRGLEKALTNKRLRSLVEPLVPQTAANMIRRVRTSNLRPAPPLPTEMRALMLEIFREEIARTETLLDMDLTEWLSTGDRR
jgi:hypothetical protein